MFISFQRAILDFLWTFCHTFVNVFTQNWCFRKITPNRALVTQLSRNKLFLIFWHFFQFLLIFLLWLWNLDDLKSFQWRNLLKRAFQLKIIYIFVFFLDFLKTRFRGFANTLSEKSQDCLELGSWNFQGTFP